MIELATAARWTFDLSLESPLFHSIEISDLEKLPYRTIASALDPIYLMRTGKRDLDLRSGWTVFFDRMQNKPHESHLGVLGKSHVSVRSHAQRASLSIGRFSAGPFAGQLRWTFFAGEAFVLQEAVVRTEQDAVAYLYDAGVVCRDSLPRQVRWTTATKERQCANPTDLRSSRIVPVRGRGGRG